MHVARDGYCGVAPLPGGLLNVAVVVRADAVASSGMSAGEYLDRWVGSLPALRECLAGCARVSPVRGVGPIGSRTRRVWAPGALLVGDAAGFFDPFTGEGIYRALRGAQVAAPLAADALERDDVSGGVLDRYEDLRRAAFGWKHGVTALVQLFVQYPALMEYALPRLAGRATPAECLGAVLGDCRDPRDFLSPLMLWSALRP
jgi:flavin-dependent dehydrogenase